MQSYRIRYTNELYHQGVKGQKWGIRRYQNEDGTYTAEGKERRRRLGSWLSRTEKDGKNKVSPAEKVAKEAGKAIRESSNISKQGSKISRERREAEIKETAKTMSDKELRDAINRLSLERQYSQLTAQNTRSGFDAATEVLETVGSVTSIAASVAAVASVVYTLKHSDDELYHHGIKGQKWGHRRYQNEDGTWTSEGKEHRRLENSSSGGGLEAESKTADEPETDSASESKGRLLSKDFHLTEGQKKALKIGAVVAGTALVAYGAYKLTNNRVIDDYQVIGKEYVDTYLEAGTSFYRIQTADNFEKYAFYATYEKNDVNKYAGLYGKNLINRKDENGNKLAQNIYQLHFKNTDKLAVPSNGKLKDVVGEMVKDSSFKSNLTESLMAAKEEMKRPSQQFLFKESLNILERRSGEMSDKEKGIVYNALNLALVNNKPASRQMQGAFYDRLKKEGYSAILDINDKTFSSYHANSPVIIFDTDKIALQSVTELSPKDINKFYGPANFDRYVKDIPANIDVYMYEAGKMIKSVGKSTMDTVNGYLTNKAKTFAST